MVSSEKLDRFITQIQSIVEDLRKHNTLTVHQHINESYYMQKEAELKLLKEQLEESKMKLEATQSRINEHYKNAFFIWRKDVRWLNQYIIKHKHPETFSN